jgi:hypothetical protein
MINTIEELLERLGLNDESKVNWNHVKTYFNIKFSEGFIETYKDNIDWFWVSLYQPLSESFIEKYSDKVEWCIISSHQKLSKEFILKNWDQLDWEELFKRKLISNKFLIKNIDKIGIISVVRNCGKETRSIYRLKETPDIIHIGCFEGTQSEAIAAIEREYENHPLKQDYIDKVNLCFNFTLID